MKYKCVSIREYETWFTIGKIYDGEIAVQPISFAGWIEIKRADDGFSAFSPANQFVPVKEFTEGLGV